MLDQEEQLRLRRILVRVWQGKFIPRGDARFFHKKFRKDAVRVVLAQLRAREINTSQAEKDLISTGQKDYK